MTSSVNFVAQVSDQDIARQPMAGTEVKRAVVLEAFGLARICASSEFLAQAASLGQQLIASTNQCNKR